MKHITNRWIWQIGWFTAMVLLLAIGKTAAMEDMPVKRLDLQAKLLRAVIKFSSRPLERMVVGIVYVEEAENIAQDFADEIGKLVYNEQPIQVMAVSADALESLEDTVNILYVTPGNTAFLERIAALAEEHHIFTCTGIPQYVSQAKKLALGFGEHKGKPQIILNLPIAKQVEHEFKNPKFLNLQATRKLVLIK